MQRFPLTTQGVQDLLAQLYAFSNAELNEEADALTLDFKRWIKKHFDLLPHQEKFLIDLNENFSNYSSIRSGFALRNRLKIEFITPTDIRRTTEEEGKRIKSLDNTTQSTNETDNSGAGGSMIFEVTY